MWRRDWSADQVQQLGRTHCGNQPLPPLPPSGAAAGPHAPQQSGPAAALPAGLHRHQRGEPLRISSRAQAGAGAPSPPFLTPSRAQAGAGAPSPPFLTPQSRAGWSRCALPPLPYPPVARRLEQVHPPPSTQLPPSFLFLRFPAFLFLSPPPSRAGTIPSCSSSPPSSPASPHSLSCTPLHSLHP